MRRPIFSISPPYNAYKTSHNLAPCWRIWIALTTAGTFEIVNHHIFKMIVVKVTGATQTQIILTNKQAMLGESC